MTEQERARQEITKELHEEYERLSVQMGWKTQEQCRVPFSLLPLANQKVMLGIADYVLHRERLIRTAEHNATVEACCKVLDGFKPEWKRKRYADNIRALLVEETVGEDSHERTQPSPEVKRG